MNTRIICFGIEEEQMELLIEYGSYYQLDIIDYLSYCKEEEESSKIFDSTIFLLDIDKDFNQCLEILVEKRDKVNCEVIFCSSNNNPDDRVRWLSLGAQQYILKPFNVGEVCIRARLLAEQVPCISDNVLALNTTTKEVTYKNQELDLTDREFEILHYLFKKKGKVVSREELNGLHGRRKVLNRSVDVHVKSIRQKINGDLIESVRGEGYRYLV